MRLEKASLKAIQYSCKNFHYSKSVPVNPFAFSVFNDKNEWCGCILYSAGANPNIGKQFDLANGQIIELLRMALNGKQESTTKALAISIKLVAKKNPNVKLLVSYADSEQGHFGTIYQATNWFYTGYSVDTNLIVNGKREHRRTLGSRLGTCSKEKIESMGFDVKVLKTKPKWKYVYALEKSLIPLCKSLAKPYPKPAALPHKGEGQSFQTEGAFDSTVPLNNSVTNP